jgi:hypothetical protein
MRTTYEVADIIDKYYNEAFRRSIPVYKQRTLSALTACRTAALGGHVDACNHCGKQTISYNSCRNRHCPKCQGLQKEMWTIQREEELLPTTYFHVVFTLPHELNGLCLRNPRFMYGLLFEAAWYVLKTFSDDPRWLDARSAATMVLHTWGQQLTLHPHVHCIVPSGGLSKSGQWRNPKRGNSQFLFPILAMTKIFKAYFLKRLRFHLEAGELPLPKAFPIGNDYYNWKENLYQKNWVIYSKPPFGGVHNVVKYLARYSHRVALTNQRILNIDDTDVTFSYRDYKYNGSLKSMTLSGSHFLSRFCLHILPLRFRKIRHYGFLANASKRKSLQLARQALKILHIEALSRQERKRLAIQRLFGTKSHQCRNCRKGLMITMDVISPNKDPPIHIYNCSNSNRTNQ